MNLLRVCCFLLLLLILSQISVYLMYLKKILTVKSESLEDLLGGFPEACVEYLPLWVIWG